ncbi:GHKL domain-containing protein [Turicibacter sanguinis]|uniref:GHKL domain-containing protein n=1 Tax=Turicibacter sanguinis TaxID=154288 RepID=UPI0018A9E8C4|nr:GHKL domain-containing protein [Turicibacter sanguinis]MDB8565240.1 GHKL domain-containing protein [Turicibacter sanguinis]
MLIFFILFLELLTLLIGVNILSDDGIGIKNFLLWLLLIQIIGQFFYMEIGFLAIFLVLFFLITCLIIKSKKIFSSILITCLPLVTLVVTNYFAQVMEMYVVKDLLSPFIVNYDREIVATILTCILTILVCYLTKYVIGKLRRFIILERKYQILILIFLLFMIVIFYVNIFIGQIQGFSSEHITLTSILFFIYACLLCGVYLALIYTLNKDSKMKQERVLNQQLHDYTIQLEQLYNNLNSFRHDYLNILVSLEEGIRTEDIEMIKGVYHRVIKPTEQIVKSNDYILGKVRKVHIVEIKSLLAEKIIKSQAKGIDVRVEIEEIIESIYMDVFSFYRVFSILLDNAIEAANSVSNSYISIVFIQDRDIQRIEVENTCEHQEISLKDIYKKGYSSKGSNRGIGLYNVQQILNDNKYCTLETFYELGVFTQTLILKREDRE